MQKGTRHTAETRRLMSEAKRGRTLSKAHRDAISAGVRAAFERQHAANDDGPKPSDNERAEGVRSLTAERPTGDCLATNRQGVQRVSSVITKPSERYDCAA